MKNKLENRFKRLYKNKRLLAIQLNGFCHKIFYDDGNKNSNIMCENFSHCMPEKNWPNSAGKIFKDISNSLYQNNAKEIIYILPNKR